MQPLSFIRRRGADMTQSLLYAALALVVVIVGFGLYRIVDTNVAKKEMSGMLINISTGMHEFGQTHRSLFDIQDVDNMLADRGMVPVAYVTSYDTVDVPGGMRLHFLFTGPRSMTMTYVGTSSKSVAVCQYLTAGTSVGERVESGKMGRNYTPIGINCDPEWTGVAQFQISYSIDD